MADSIYGITGTVPTPGVNGAVLGGCVVPIVLFWAGFAYVYWQLLTPPAVDFQMINAGTNAEANLQLITTEGVPFDPPRKQALPSTVADLQAPLLVVPTAKALDDDQIVLASEPGSPIRLAQLHSERRWGANSDAALRSATHRGLSLRGDHLASPSRWNAHYDQSLATADDMSAVLQLSRGGHQGGGGDEHEPLPPLRNPFEAFSRGHAQRPMTYPHMLLPDQ